MRIVRGLGLIFVRSTSVYFYYHLKRICSSIIRANSAEEALGALKGGLAKAAPDSFMMWLHGYVC